MSDIEPREVADKSLSKGEIKPDPTPDPAPSSSDNSNDYAQFDDDEY